MKTGAIIQARMSSMRLPGKITKELPYGSGITALGQVIGRLKKCSLLDEVIVATTTDRSDAGVPGLAKKAGAKAFRGSLEDVLARYYQAAKKFRLDVIVRITGDCPCVDPALVDALLRRHLAAKADYTANVVKLTYPDGLDIEVFNFAALEAAYGQAREAADREHVTSWLRNHPKLFKIVSCEAPVGFRWPELRVTLDTAEDYTLLCAVYDYLYTPRKAFTFREVTRLLEKKPWLQLINKRSLAKQVFKDRREELRRAIKVLELQELGGAAAVLKKDLKK